MIFVQIQLKRGKQVGENGGYHNYEFGTFKEKLSRTESYIDFPESNRETEREDYYVKNREFKRIS